MIPEKASARFSVINVADLFQRPPVKGKLIFSQFSDKHSMKHLLGLQLWHLFRYAELTEIVRQNDKLVIDLLNKVWVGNIDDGAKKLFKTRFIHESDENYPKDILQMYTKNKPAMKRNEAVLNDYMITPGECYTIQADEKIPDNCKYALALFQAAKNQKQTNTGGFAKLVKLKFDAKVMTAVNIVIQDRLINGQTRNTRHIQFAQGSFRKVYVKFFHEQANLKVISSSYLGNWKMWNWDFNKERTNIAIHQAYSVSLNISMGIYHGLKV